MNAPFEFLLGNDPGFVQRYINTTVAVGLRYFLIAGVAWLMAYRWFRNRWAHRKVLPRFPGASDVRRELQYSIGTILIAGIAGAATISATRQGWTRMYFKVSDHGWGWFVASILLAILIHDTYFYWTHRLMHVARLFPLFHRIHHLSNNPSPWAAYSFAPAEAVVQAGIFPVIVMILPIHPLAFVLFTLWQILFNVAGHTGFEFHPRWLMNTPLWFLLNTPTNHVLHHETMRGNYGLYFNFWDRLMGTSHPDYESRFREVTSRTAPHG
jgi:lathosterol oxidase